MAMQRSLINHFLHTKSQLCGKPFPIFGGLLRPTVKLEHVPMPVAPLPSQIRHITKLTTFNVVDNSKLGQKTRRYKKPYLIGFYRKRKTADIGDVIKVAVQGKTSRALVVSTRKPKSQPIPRYDNNNIVLLDDNNAPLGTRIKGPIPAILRKDRAKFSKVIALASRFV